MKMTKPLTVIIGVLALGALVFNVNQNPKVSTFSERKLTIGGIGRFG